MEGGEGFGDYQSVLLHMDGFVYIVEWARGRADIESSLSSPLWWLRDLDYHPVWARNGWGKPWKRGALVCTQTSWDLDTRGRIEASRENVGKNARTDLNWRKEELVSNGGWVKWGKQIWGTEPRKIPEGNENGRKKNFCRCLRAGKELIRVWGWFEGHFFSLFPCVA